MKILVLTSKYPSSETVPGFTPVAHYFTKEWVKIGHTVKVIHNQSEFPFFLYWIPQLIRGHFESKFGFTFPVKKMNREKRYVLDLVRVHRIPISRFLPFIKYSNRSIVAQIEKIIESNRNDEFIPDIIISHWLNPQLPIMKTLRIYYNCRSAIVLHSVETINGTSKEGLQDLLNSVDVIGFRSNSIMKEYLKTFNEPQKHFICHSGVKDEYLKNTPKRHFKDKLTNFLYVGTLIKRKNVDSILKALKYLDYLDYKFTIIGDGPERHNLENSVRSLDLTDTVHFLGYLDRSDVMRAMEESECFIMISSNETFGLVYMEAMAMGCLVVASLNEGMDGIIQHGINGFLCDAGNTFELAKTISEIHLLSGEEKIKISINAVETAKRYSESNVALNYLNSVTTIN
jgi:glycosyltransferase involved in cell wall biosynthesis